MSVSEIPESVTLSDECSSAILFVYHIGQDIRRDTFCFIGIQEVLLSEASSDQYQQSESSKEIVMVTVKYLSHCYS